MAEQLEPGPTNLRNVNLNQFALPGMEEHSHPLARHLAHGVTFQHDIDYVHRARPYPRGHAGTSFTRAQSEGSQEAVPYEHHLLAHRDDKFVAQLNWAGAAGERRDEGSGHYPGEVTWVENISPGRSPKGLLSDMYRAGHAMNFGQSTVPVHSPDRTEMGEAWSKKVGHPAFRPQRYDFSYRPPQGVHPFEQTNLQTQQFNPIKGQGVLFKRDVLRGY